MTTIPAPTPALSGRDINIAAFATRALLERLIDETGVAFADWTALTAVEGAGDAGLARSALVARQSAALQVPPAAVEEGIATLIAQGLVSEDTGTLVLTAAGEAVFRPVQVATQDLIADLYRDFPPEDLATTQRTLAEVTRRANLRLAG
jgi:DNA-binding MarR family transcriptional regulator